MSNITTTKGFAPATLTEAVQFSQMLAESSMVPKQYQGKPQDILVCVQWGYEMGLAPMQALQNIAVINGKPSVYGDAAMALVQASPVCEGVEERVDGEGTPNPVAVCIAHRKGRKPVTATFSVEDAKRAGLWGKQGPWQAYPKRMLQMRARGFALRDAFPDVLKGLITAEEAQDYPAEKPDKYQATPASTNPLDALAAPAPAPAPVEEVAAPAEEVVVDVSDVPVIEDGAYKVMVPGKDVPASTHASLDEWSIAYEDMAEKIFKAGKRPARERMTILREFKEANQTTIDAVDSVKRVRHTSGYQARLRSLGAQNGV
jgi:hypothetical protein